MKRSAYKWTPTALLPVCIFSVAQAAAPSFSQLPFTVSKETTVVTAPLFPSGMPNYAAAFDGQMSRGVTPENNLFAAYLKITGTGPTIIVSIYRQQVLNACGLEDGPDPPDRWISYSHFLQSRDWGERTADKVAEAAEERFATQAWDENTDALFSEYLKSRDRNLDDAIRMSSRPRFWIPWMTDIPWLFSEGQLPGLAPFRQITCALDARAMLRLNHGDTERAIADVLAALRISRTIQQHPFFITRLVGIASESFSLRSISAMAASGTLSASQCDSLRHGIANTPLPRPLRDSLLDGERYATLCFIEAIALGAGRKDYAVVRRDRVNWDNALKTANSVLDDLHSIMARPTLKQVTEGQAEWMDKINEWKRESEAPDAPSLAPKEGERNAQYTDRVTRYILQALLPRVGRSEELERCARMEAAMTNTLLLLAKAYAQEKTWPANESQISVPLPSDIYNDGHTVHYELTPAGPTLQFFSHAAGSNGILGARSNNIGSNKR